MKTLIQKFVALGIAAFCTIYLLNPGAGFIEFIPDNMPFLGNFDEAAAVLLLVRCLATLGFDLSIFTRFRKAAEDFPRPVNADPIPPQPRRTRATGREKDVIDV
jgi:uncharacterized membrane protein YkvA (DUF1232 family)